MFSKILAILSWSAVLLLWACAASPYANPSEWWGIPGLFGLCFPFCAAAVVVMGMVCLLIKPRLAWIAAVGLLGCCGALRDYLPINLSSPPPKGCLKVMTYNVCAFSNWKTDERGNLVVMEYVCAQKPHLACLQEATYKTPAYEDTLMRTVRRYGYHYRKEQMGQSAVGLLSRFPIAKSRLLFCAKANGAAAFWVLPPGGDTVVVVNVHLESMHLSKEDRTNYHLLVRNPEAADSVKSRLGFLRKIANASHERAHQTDSLTQFLDQLKGRPVIVMGDFNDTPISYAHRQVCSRLNDVYRATGNGIGRTFNKDAIYVRIDNIFCSDHWKPFAAMVENAVDYSDHYAITAYLKPQVQR